HEADAGVKATFRGGNADSLLRVFQSLHVEVNQREVTMAGNLLCPYKALYFKSGPTGHVEYLRPLHLAGELLSQFNKPIVQNGDAIAVRASGTDLMKVTVDQLGVGRGTIAPVRQHHVDHPVVAGVAQRFGIGTVEER